MNMNKFYKELQKKMNDEMEGNEGITTLEGFKEIEKTLIDLIYLLDDRRLTYTENMKLDMIHDEVEDLWNKLKSLEFLEKELLGGKK